MTPQGFPEWFAGATLLTVAVLVLCAMVGASVGGRLIRLAQKRWALGEGYGEKALDGQEGYIVSAILGLLALLLGFTFSLSIDRFETRRTLVLEEANAIGTAFLRTQLLDAPHRQQISCLLLAYTENRISLATAQRPKIQPMLITNDRMIAELWALTMAAFPSIKSYDFSSTFLESVNHVIELDAARKTARLAHVPPEVFFVLFVYITAAAGILGYVLVGFRSSIPMIFLCCLLTLSFVLIVDIDSPAIGGVRESQGPMKQLRVSLHAFRPPSDCLTTETEPQ